MTKVALKIFAMLEFIGARHGKGILPNDLVKALGINQGTCIRILKELVQMGYLDQISRQHGYVLGPMAHWLSRHSYYRKDLLEVAEPLVKNLAESEGQSVLVATLHEGRRFILCHHNHNPLVNPDVDGPWFNDLTFTATGQVLLAHAPAGAQKALVKKCGVPKIGPWKGFSSFAQYEKEFDRIRQRGYVSMDMSHTGLFIVAYPIWRSGLVEAAVGMSVPQDEARGAKEKYFIDALGACAGRINQERRSLRGVG